MNSNFENDLIGSKHSWSHWRVVPCPDCFTFCLISQISQVDYGFEDFIVVKTLRPISIVSEGGNFSLRNHSEVDSGIGGFWEWIESPTFWHKELNKEFSFSDLLLGDWGSHFNFGLLFVVSKDVSTENVEGLISGVVVSSLDNCFGDDPSFIGSDLEFSNCFFNGVCRAVVVGNDEWAENNDETG